MKPRRPNETPGEVVWQLGALTVRVAGGSCHACGRFNAGLEYSSARPNAPVVIVQPVVICHLCMKELVTARAEYLKAVIRRGSQ